MESDTLKKCVTESEVCSNAWQTTKAIKIDETAFSSRFHKHHIRSRFVANILVTATALSPSRRHAQKICIGVRFAANVLHKFQRKPLPEV